MNPKRRSTGIYLHRNLSQRLYNASDLTFTIDLYQVASSPRRQKSFDYLAVRWAVNFVVRLDQGMHLVDGFL